MKFSSGIVLALAAVAVASPTGTGSSKTKATACKASTKKVGSSGVASSIVASSVASSGKASLSRPASSVVASSVVASSGVSASKPASSKVSSGTAVSSRAASSRVSSGGASGSGASKSGGSGSGGSGSGGSGSGSSCPVSVSTVTVGSAGDSTVTVTSAVTVTVSGSGSGPSPTTLSSCDPSATPLPPSQDPWYNAPDGYENAAPGAVLKVRNACGLVSKVANSSAAYNILYRTTDSLYNATWAVTTLLVPINPSNNLLSYQYPYDSADVDSSPSYGLYGGGGLFGDADITAALGRGDYVVTPDYETYKASFTSGPVSGMATIDSARACIGPDSPVDLSTASLALWGYSGGALASEWALEMAVQYAPALRIAGAALGGLTPNVTSVLFTINGTIYAGLAPAGILGLASQHPDAEAYLQSHLIQSGETYNATTFNAARNYSLAQDIGAYAGQNLALYFTNGFEALLSKPAQMTINSDGIMGAHGTPKPDLFVYKAIGDDISNITDTDALVNRYCTLGATIDYQRNTVGNHATELINGAPRAVAFLESVFAGTYSASGCQISNVSVQA